MRYPAPSTHGNFSEPSGRVADEDQWFLPGPVEDAPVVLLSGPGAGPGDTLILADWTKAEADLAARLARVAARLGGLDDRLLRGPEGWRHRFTDRAASW